MQDRPIDQALVSEISENKNKIFLLQSVNLQAQIESPIQKETGRQAGKSDREDETVHNSDQKKIEDLQLDIKLGLSKFRTIIN